MKLKDIYRHVINKGIEADIRGKKQIDKILKAKKTKYNELDKNQKEGFDTDSFFNPFADTRILSGAPDANIKSIIVGIDVEGEELLVVDRLKSKSMPIDLVISHHPEGRAFANFYEVMDLQVDILAKAGLSVSTSENLLSERRVQVERRVHSANHQRSIDIARLLKLNFLCMHTPCDNLAYRHLRRILDKETPSTLGQILDVLYSIPEYKASSKNNNPPKIVIGNKRSRCKNIFLEFTGGTEGPKGVYKELSSKGIDTIVAMHQSEEHFKKCKEANINVIFASHIASDNIGINLMLDSLEKKAKFKIHEFSGFRRCKHKK